MCVCLVLCGASSYLRAIPILLWGKRKRERERDWSLGEEEIEGDQIDLRKSFLLVDMCVCVLVAYIRGRIHI